MSTLPSSSFWSGGRSLRLVGASLLAVALLGARMAWTRSGIYGFLAWNLFLAWLPYLMAQLLARLDARRARRGWRVLVGALWLVFLPNAPYIVTDFVHLRYRDDAPLWFDACMLMAFAWTGLHLGIASLRTCAGLVQARGGRRVAALFVIIAAVLSGYGIYLGRFVRLNSWDLALQPQRCLAEVLRPFGHPFAMHRAWTVTITLSLLFLVAYLTMGRGERAVDEDAAS